MSDVRTVDNILFEALYHAETHASGLTAQESAMYRRVREDIERYGGYVAAHKHDPEPADVEEVAEDAQEVAYQRAGESVSATKPVADDHRDVRVVKKTPVVFKVDSGELARKLDEVWPVDEETGEKLPAADVPRPALIQEARVVLQQLLGSFVPTAVTSKLVDLYVAVRREYDSQVRLLDSRAGIDDERRPSMRERFDDERRQSASETLSEAAPYQWGRRTSLVVG